MCPIPHTTKYKDIIDDHKVPQHVRDAASEQLQQQALVQEALSQASTEEKKLSRDNNDFTCSIYNLHNKQYWGNWVGGEKVRPDNVSNLKEVMALQGDKLYESRNGEDFLAKGTDGTLI